MAKAPVVPEMPLHCGMNFVAATSRNLSTKLWSHLFGDSCYQYVFDDDDNNYNIVLQDDMVDVLQQDFVGTTIQNASPASLLPVLPSAMTCAVPSDALPSDQWPSLSPATKNIESFPQGDSHSPPIHCSVQHSLDANFGVLHSGTPHTTHYLTGALPPPCYITSSSGCPVTFDPTSVYGGDLCGPNGTSLWHSSTTGPTKTPTMSTLNPHAFDPTTLAVPNISLEGGMSSQRELCSPQTNRLTPSVASTHQSVFNSLEGGRYKFR